MVEAPIEVKIAMQEFWAQQKAEERKRAQKKQEQALRRCVENKAKKPLTAKEVQRYARNFGVSVENGRGRHGVHLVASNGKECPLPVHGGGKTLAIGTQASIISFVNQNGIRSQYR